MCAERGIKMFIVKGFYKGMTTTQQYETEEEARSEGMKLDGDVFMRNGENGFPILLKYNWIITVIHYLYSNFIDTEPPTVPIIMSAYSKYGFTSVLNVSRSVVSGTSYTTSLIFVPFESKVNISK